MNSEFCSNMKQSPAFKSLWEPSNCVFELFFLSKAQEPNIAPV